MENQNRQKLTCIIGTKDSQYDIKECIESAGFCDEMIVIDDFSSDRTVEIDRSCTDKVFQRKLIGYPEQIDFAIRQSANRWILVLDADERITPELKSEILDKLSVKPEVSGYLLRRQNIFLGKPIKHCGWYQRNNLRLFDKENVNYDLTMKYLVRMHIAGKLGEVEYDLLHYTCRDLYGYFKRMNLWSSLNTEDLIDKGYSITLFNTLYYLLLKPLIVFFYKYFLKAGFLDGFAGFLICVLSACTYFLSYAKLSKRQGVSIRRLVWRRPWKNDPVFPGRKRYTEKGF